MGNKELKEKFVEERTGIEYRLVEDYYIPNIIIPKARRTGNIGKLFINEIWNWSEISDQLEM